MASVLRRNDLRVSDAFLSLLRVHALPGLDRQLWLDRLAGNAEWWIDQSTGQLTLGDRLRVAIEFIGSEAERPRTWKWAWANPYVDEPLTNSVQKLRRKGEAELIPELASAEFGLTGFMSGHALSLVACGLAGFDAHFRAAYPGGAAFVMLRLPEEQRRPTDEPLDRAFAVLSTAPAAIPMPLGRAEVTRYLKSLGLSPRHDDDGVRISADSRAVEIDFDRNGRVSGVRADL